MTTTPVRAALESALRARQLDRTLTTALPSLEAPEAALAAPTGVEPLDACLRGGVPRGQLSELAGSRSSGRTAVCLQLIAAATRRGEIAALVDAGDRLDVTSAAAAGIDLGRLLWIRGQPGDRVHTAPGRDRLDRVLEQALKAVMLVLHAGGFGLVVLDLADIPPAALTHLPFTTWLRIQRAVAGRDTACVLVVPVPVARSAGGLTLALTARSGWSGAAARSRRLERLDIQARVVSPRRRLDAAVSMTASIADDTDRGSG